MWCPIIIIYQLNINIDLEIEHKVEKRKKKWSRKDSDQIGQLPKLCLIDFFSMFHYFWGLSIDLGMKKQCAVMSFPEEKKKGVKRLLSSTNVS